MKRGCDGVETHNKKEPSEKGSVFYSVCFLLLTIIATARIPKAAAKRIINILPSETVEPAPTGS